MANSHTPIEQYLIDTIKTKRIEKGYSPKELAYMLDAAVGRR